METTRQAITWGRFSSDQQKDGDSKDRQQRLNRECAKRVNVQVIKEYFDESKSVKSEVTPLFRKVIADLPNGVGIVAENLDRINRAHPWKQKAYIYEIVKDGHFIITSQDGTEYNNETIDQVGTVATGDLQTNLANAENVKRTKRVKEAKTNAVELARQCKPAPLGAWLPAHLKYNPKTKVYDIDEDRKAFFEKLFTDYANGKGVTLITKELNEKGIPTFRSKTVGGWQKSTIFTMLRFEGLIGVLNYQGERITNAFPPAISEKLFYQVQAILETNKSKAGNYKSNNVLNILRGVAKCSHCGSTMTATKDNYLGCSGHHLGRCGVKNMIRNYVDTEIAFAAWFVPMAKDALLGKDASFTAIETLTAKKNALTGKIEATVALMDSGLALNEVRSRLVKLESERTAIENDIATAKASQASNATLPQNIKELESIIKGIKDDQAIRKQVADIVPTLIKRVDIDLQDKWFPSFKVTLTNDKTVEWTQTNLGKNKAKAIKAMDNRNVGINANFKANFLTLPEPNSNR